MRLGRVIGRVTLSQAAPSLQGARWLIVSPLGRDDLSARPGAAAVSREPSLVVYDDLGGAPGDLIGFVEGREAAMPFEQPTPVDAINGALISNVYYHPMP